jgi:hypothetical protein
VCDTGMKERDVKTSTSYTAIYESRLQHLIRSNDWFMTALEAVRDCNPPDWFVGSGVVRNIVWDHSHGYTQPTPLTDVDVAFFDPDDLTPGRDRAVQEQLLNRLPDVPWQAKNQALFICGMRTSSATRSLPSSRAQMLSAPGRRRRPASACACYSMTTCSWRLPWGWTTCSR